MPVGTYTPFDTVGSDDGVAIAAEVETVRGKSTTDLQNYTNNKDYKYTNFTLHLYTVQHLSS